MKIRFIALFVVSFFGVNVSAQQKSKNEAVEATIFGLLKLKYQYDSLMWGKRTNSEEERQTIAAAELAKSDYGKRVQQIQANPKKYLTFLERTINTAADSLKTQEVNYELQPLWSSANSSQYIISKLDYLRAFQYSLFDQKAGQLLHLYQVPGITLKYPKPTPLYH